MDRGLLIQNAIKEAYSKQDLNTIVDENGWKTRFIIKNKAVWMQILSPDNRITSSNRVYKLNTENPYVRDMARYWKLDEESKKIAYRLYAEIA